MNTVDVDREKVPFARCADCGIDIRKSDGFATYKGGLYKCAGCFVIDPMLRPKCEVYSRVCGYLRPTEHWNDAKQEEFRDRKNFVAPYDAD